MSKYRIINTKPQSFSVQEKIWWGWTTVMGFGYFTFNESECESYIDDRLEEQKWIPKPPRIYP